MWRALEIGCTSIRDYNAITKDLIKEGVRPMRRMDNNRKFMR
jgi:hypothetical protein